MNGLLWFLIVGDSAGAEVSEMEMSNCQFCQFDN